ncbi:pyruvate dehydrogenase (acetyl-transferring) E1 component subunit alpha [Kribbia dieselivorans]|uniref:pyruvate dehydrogenase (acetyl-transferring) E1 component subunit alpha n=1 Tax=Kribbia dieselivorans TaxID=331526 RepID=UPI00278C677B|nr:pyruvate dehydrogenase (acetyl-transferring) E1 component subunit alpha [Kribbia dieselivorans]
MSDHTVVTTPGSTPESPRSSASGSTTSGSRTSGPASASAHPPTARSTDPRLHRDLSRGGPEMVQLLTPAGQRVPDPAWDRWIDDLTPDDLRGFYRDLVIVRRYDSEGHALQRQGELGLWPSLKGQEAAQIGAAAALRDQDHVFPTYREHGVAYARGVDPLSPLAVWRGTTTGGWDPDEHNFHLFTVVIGAQTLHATGYAMGVRLDGACATGHPETDVATLAFLGDGATAQGDVNEAFVYAAAFDAPVVFFVQNNQWAISAPVTKQTRVPLYQRAAGFGFPGLRVDGNDVLAVLAVTRAALAEARSGQGPLLVEAFTYRMGAHTTADDPTRYRSAEEVEAWADRDPIARLRAHLVAQGWADGAFFAEVDAAADAFAADVRARLLALPDPDPSTMWDHVYAEDHPVMAAEQAAQAEYLASFVEDGTVEDGVEDGAVGHAEGQEA